MGYVNGFVEVVDVVVGGFFVDVILVVFGNDKVVGVVGVDIEIGDDMVGKVIGVGWW